MKVEDLDKEIIKQIENSQKNKFLRLPLQLYKQLWENGKKDPDLDSIQTFLEDNELLKELSRAINSTEEPKTWDLFWITCILNSIYEQLENNKLIENYFDWIEKKAPPKFPLITCPSLEKKLNHLKRMPG